MEKFKPIVLDANILIDFYESKKEIFKNIKNVFNKVCIPIPIIREVCQVREKDLKKLQITLHEPKFEEIVEASERGGPLSFQDKICLIVCRNNNWCLATNDKKLRSKCKVEGITILWGLELLIILYRNNEIPKKTAIMIADKILKTNSRITDEIFKEFLKKLE